MVARVPLALPRLLRQSRLIHLSQWPPRTLAPYLGAVDWVPQHRSSNNSSSSSSREVFSLRIIKRAFLGIILRHKLQPILSLGPNHRPNHSLVRVQFLDKAKRSRRCLLAKRPNPHFLTACWSVVRRGRCLLLGRIVALRSYPAFNWDLMIFGGRQESLAQEGPKILNMA